MCNPQWGSGGTSGCGGCTCVADGPPAPGPGTCSCAPSGLGNLCLAAVNNCNTGTAPRGNPQSGPGCGGCACQ